MTKIRKIRGESGLVNRFYKYAYQKNNFNYHEKRKRFMVLDRHPFGRNKYWQATYQYFGDRTTQALGLARCLHAANARFVQGLPERLMSTSQLFPVERVEDDIRQSLWNAASKSGVAMPLSKMTEDGLFTDFLFPTVFQHLWRLPHTRYSRTSHLSSSPRLDAFFSRWGQNGSIRERSGMLLRNSVKMRPYAEGDEIPRVLSTAMKPDPEIDFRPCGSLQGLRRVQKETCVVGAGFLQGTGEFNRPSAVCGRPYAISHFMKDMFSSEGQSMGAVGTAVLRMFAQLHSQVQVREVINKIDRTCVVRPGSGPHARGHQLEVPEAVHGMVTDGQHFTFLAFQLHSTAPEFDGYENIFWSSETMKLYEDFGVDAAGPELNLDCLRLIATLLHYDPHLYWPCFAEQTQDFMDLMENANQQIGRTDLSYATSA